MIGLDRQRGKDRWSTADANSAEKMRGEFRGRQKGKADPNTRSSSLQLRAKGSCLDKMPPDNTDKERVRVNPVESREGSLGVDLAKYKTRRRGWKSMQEPWFTAFGEKRTGGGRSCSN